MHECPPCHTRSASGAGNTELFSLVTDFFHAQFGLIGVWVIPCRPSRRHLAPSHRRRKPTLTHAAWTCRRRRRRRICEELDWRDERVRSLSGRQLSSGEISRALMHRSRLPILDDPTTGLDARRALHLDMRDRCKARYRRALATPFIEERARGNNVVGRRCRPRRRRLGWPARRTHSPLYSNLPERHKRHVMLKERAGRPPLDPPDARVTEMSITREEDCRSAFLHAAFPTGLPAKAPKREHNAGSIGPSPPSASNSIQAVQTDLA